MGLKVFLLFIALSPVALSKKDPDSMDPLSQEFVDYINSLNTTWKAERQFKYATLDYVEGLMGTILDSNETQDLPTISHFVTSQIPAFFDSRQKWPNCKSIGLITDQSECASCWAVSSTTVMSDRFCIHSNGKVKVLLSYEDALTCCGAPCGKGCNAGLPHMAFQYMVREGVPTGGPYGSTTCCMPYYFQPCSHGVTEPSLRKCTGNSPTPKCRRQCISTYAVPYNKDKFFGKSAYKIRPNVAQIQMEIMVNGPIVTGFQAYPEFSHYKSGVYHHTTGRIGLGHAVKMIGWGVENGVPYWLCVNSWNENWGDRGLFKIRRGRNECKIEDYLTAGLPKVLKEKEEIC